MRERFTLGVEEEYLVVDPANGELRSGGRAALDTDLSGDLSGEVQDTLLEIGTPVCNDAAELLARLRERRFQAGAAAAAVDLEILAIGAHPFSGWVGQELTETARSLMLQDQFRHLLRVEHISGMHVHVAIPEGVDRIQLLNIVRGYTPHLLALACSSPFHAGQATGFASYRTIAWRRYPMSGVPPRFESAAEYRAFIDMLLESRLIPDERTLYWSVRPSPRYPTLEIRVCDVCPRIDEAVAIASLARAVVVAAAERRLSPVGDSLAPGLQDVVLAENEWLAARDGLDAMVVVPEAEGHAIPIRTAIAELVESVRPIMESYRDAESLDRIAAIVAEGNAADRMRAEHAASGGDINAVVAWGLRETRAGSGMDRRREARA